jgi:hypothetical protein
VEASSDGTGWAPLLLLTNETGSVRFSDPRPEPPAAAMYRTRIVD